MFGGASSNPYDDIVAKTTDENLTTENWELILNLCDKVTDEGPNGARNVIAAILKRLSHRNPNVQLYALSLSESLSKNCGLEVNREIASRSFTQGLEKVIQDRSTHDKVKKRALALIAMWTQEFENDDSLGIMEECYSNLKAKNFKFEAPSEPVPPTVDDEIRRKEEEELQRVLEMSMQDKGGRDPWSSYSTYDSSGAGGSSSSAQGASSSSAGATHYEHGYAPAASGAASSSAANDYTAPSSSYSAPSAAAATSRGGYSLSDGGPVAASSVPLDSSPEPTSTPTSSGANLYTVTRVIALHPFTPSEPGELAFEKGDIIKVVDRGYKDWWRGQLKGRTGIFPVNYVEPLPEPTPQELAKEAQSEAEVFSQAVNVEKLLNMLRQLQATAQQNPSDPAVVNLADNEEIQEMYRQAMGLRPKIVKLIDKYSQKRADLVSMNETFVRARTIFDRMMEESLARHSGVYDQPYGPSYGPVARPDSRVAGQGGYAYIPGPAGPPGPNAGGYGFPAPMPGQQADYGQRPPEHGPYPGPYGTVAGAPGQAPGQVGPQQYPQQVPGQIPTVGHGQQQPAAQGYGPQGQGPIPYPAMAPVQQVGSPTPGQQGPPNAQSPPLQQQQSYMAGAIPQPLSQQAAQTAASLAQSQPTHTGPQSGPSAVPAHIGPHQGDSAQQSLQAQPGSSVGPNHSGIGGSAPVAGGYVGPASVPGAGQQQLPQSQAHGQQFAQPSAAVTDSQSPEHTEAPAEAQKGPPYAYSPSVKYEDPNVQAWADYYAKGGKEKAGLVYFKWVPGVSEGQPPSETPPQAQGSIGGAMSIQTQGLEAQPHGQGQQVQAATSPLATSPNPAMNRMSSYGSSNSFGAASTLGGGYQQPYGAGPNAGLEESLPIPEGMGGDTPVQNTTNPIAGGFDSTTGVGAFGGHPGTVAGPGSPGQGANLQRQSSLPTPGSSPTAGQGAFGGLNGGLGAGTQLPYPGGAAAGPQHIGGLVQGPSPATTPSWVLPKVDPKTSPRVGGN